MSEKPYTYVDRFGAGIGVTNVRNDAVLLSLYGPKTGDAVHIEIPAAERHQLALAISDKLDRVLTALREQRSGPGPFATVPVGAILAAIFIDTRPPSAAAVKRAHEIQALLDAEEPTTGREPATGADDAADEEPLGSGGETAPSSPQEAS